jgi:hypothetical protein
MPTPHAVDPFALYRAWYAAAGPWAGYFRAVPLIALARGVVRRVPPADEAVQTTARALATALLSRGGAAGWLGRPDVLLVLDLPAAQGVEATRLLADHRVRPVLVLLQWPAPRAVVPCEPLLAALVAPPPRPAHHAAQYALVLARERATPIAPGALATRLDTRYHLGAADLPDAAQLRAAGIAALLVVRHAALPWPADLVDYARGLVRHGLPVHDLPLQAHGPTD